MAIYRINHHTTYFSTVFKRAKDNKRRVVIHMPYDKKWWKKTKQIERPNQGNQHLCYHQPSWSILQSSQLTWNVQLLDTQGHWKANLKSTFLSLKSEGGSGYSSHSKTMFLTVQIWQPLRKISWQSYPQNVSKSSSFTDFWIYSQKDFPQIWSKALLSLSAFEATYLRESGFSSLTYLKSKYQVRVWHDALPENFHLPRTESCVKPTSHHTVSFWSFMFHC